jgi:6-methylsalicylate decarboxylase
VNRFTTVRYDLHQHLWPAPFLAALRARTAAPRLDGWVLELADAAFAIEPDAHDPEQRAATGPDVIAIGVSAALGVDRLPTPEAAELAAAWHEGALALGDPFAVWATGRDADALHAALDQGAIGLELAADALVAPDAFDTLAPLLETLGDRPLFVHPGPSADPDRDGWWTPVVGYVSQLHAAWWAWADGGRERFPQVPVLFAALGGLGPLHGERFRARGGHGGPVDPLTFVETSTYGTQAVDATVRVLGIDVICRGSDLPYAAPAPLAFDAAALHAIDSANPHRLLTPLEVPA